MAHCCYQAWLISHVYRAQGKHSSVLIIAINYDYNLKCGPVKKLRSHTILGLVTLPRGLVLLPALALFYLCFNFLTRYLVSTPATLKRGSRWSVAHGSSVNCGDLVSSLDWLLIFLRGGGTTTKKRNYYYYYFLHVFLLCRGLER